MMHTKQLNVFKPACSRSIHKTPPKLLKNWILIALTFHSECVHTSHKSMDSALFYKLQSSNQRIKQHSNANTWKLRQLNRPRQALLFLPFNFLQQRPAYCSGTEYVFSVKITRIMPRKKPALAVTFLTTFFHITVFYLENSRSSKV